MHASRFLVLRLLAVVSLFSASCATARSVADDPVRVWLTTPDQSHLLAEQSSLRWLPVEQAGGESDVLQVDAARRYQRIHGFGASLTDASASLIHNLPDDVRRHLMRKLFSARDGIGLNVVRKPVGASDFSLEHYTYQDMHADAHVAAQAPFSIARDREFVLPVLWKIRRFNSDLRIMATPWSAPAWMKTNRSLFGGRLEPKHYATYADYLVRFLRAYGEQGLPVESLTVQNEPAHAAEDYPSMLMEPQEQAEFIKVHLGPALASARLSTKLFIWDHNWNRPDYPLAILKDAEAARYVAGTAFHGYEGEPSQMLQVAAAAPEKEIRFTELSAGAWSTDFAANFLWDLRTLIIGTLGNQSSTVLKWNFALDETHGPRSGGCKNCHGLVTVAQSVGGLIYNYDYYALGHVSKFVRRGAHRIHSAVSGADLHAIAFSNPDASIVALAVNGGRTERNLTVRWQDRQLHYTLPAGAAATLTWQTD